MAIEATNNKNSQFATLSRNSSNLAVATNKFGVGYPSAALLSAQFMLTHARFDISIRSWTFSSGAKIFRSHFSCQESRRKMTKSKQTNKSQGEKRVASVLLSSSSSASFLIVPEKSSLLSSLPSFNA